MDESIVQSLPRDLAIVKIEHESIMAMAAAHPRNYEGILETIQRQVELSPEFAEKALYSRPVGKECVCVTCKATQDDWKTKKCSVCGGPTTMRTVFASGLSIRAAEAMAEAYGFNRVRCTSTQINPDLLSIDANFTDYQRGRQWEQNVLVSRFEKKRNGETYRLDDARFELKQKAKASIAIREVILRSVPPGLRAALEKQVRSLVRLDEDRVSKIIATFRAKGVEPELIERFLGRPRIVWTNDDRSRLLEVLNAIEDGETTVAAVFLEESTQEEQPVQETVAERAKRKLSRKEQEHLQRATMPQVEESPLGAETQGSP